MVAFESSTSEGNEAMTGGPLDNAENEFTKLDLDLSDLAVLVRGDEGPYVDSVRELRSALVKGQVTREVRDEVWRRAVVRAQDDEAWMVAAIGLGMPYLKTSARKLGRDLDPRTVEEIEEELLAGFIAGVRSAKPSWKRIHWSLRCRAHRAGIRLVKQVRTSPFPVAETGAATPVTHGHPDLVLEDALRQGVLTEEEVELIGRTRLERIPLVRIAEATGIAYWALAKRRSRAEERLKEALRDQAVSARNLHLSVV